MNDILAMHLNLWNFVIVFVINDLCLLLLLVLQFVLVNHIHIEPAVVQKCVKHYILTALLFTGNMCLIMYKTKIFLFSYFIPSLWFLTSGNLGIQSIESIKDSFAMLLWITFGRSGVGCREVKKIGGLKLFFSNFLNIVFSDLNISSLKYFLKYFFFYKDDIFLFTKDWNF